MDSGGAPPPRAHAEAGGAKPVQAETSAPTPASLEELQTAAAAHASLESSWPGAAGRSATAGPSLGQPGSVGPLTAAQLLANTQSAGGTLAAAAGGPELTAPVGSGAWTEQLGARLTWMTQQGIQSASLQLSPRDLGPLQVSISVQHGQASVWFGAQQAETRQALAQALPQLRTLLAHQGLTLTDAGVAHDAPHNAQAEAALALRARGAAAGSEAEATGDAVPVRGIGLIDTYA